MKKCKCCKREIDSNWRTKNGCRWCDASAKKGDNMRVLKPYVVHSKICLPCDLCGDEVRTVSAYLNAKSDSKVNKGFYPDLSLHLCEKCIDKMKKTIKE